MTSDLSPLPSLPPGHWPRLPVPADAGSFELPASKAGGITPLQVALQRKWGILAFAVIVSAITWIVVRQLPVRYTASASVMLDSRQPRVSSGESILPSQTIDNDLLRTRMEALRSVRLAQEVVEQLGLTTSPQFCSKPESLTDHFSRLIAPLVGGARISAPSLARCQVSVEAAAKQLATAVSFNNDSRSYVIQITAEAGDPDLAAKIANAYANRFVDRQHREITGLTDQANEWLGTHLAQLRAEVVAADAAVEEQRRGGQLNRQHGETLLGQSLSELNTQLSAATSDLTQKQSTLRGLESLAASGAVAASAPVLNSPIVQRLIDRESALAVAQADLGARFGSANPQVLANAAQLAQVRQQIRTEVNKAVIGLRNEVQTLEARRAALAANVRDLQSQVGDQSSADMRLQDLERDAASARSRYDAAAVRLEQIRVEAATLRADVQPLVEAATPEFPTYPRTQMIVVGTFLASLGVGAGLAFALALMSRFFRDPEDVEEQTGLRVLGLFPRPLRRRAKPQDAVVDDPTSREAEALHAVFAHLMRGHYRGDARAGRALMVTSALPGEGKTSFCVALGRAATARGLSAVLVDCDLRRSTMRSLFPTLEQPRKAPSGRGGDDAEPESRFADLAVDRSSGVHVVPAPAESRNLHAILVSAGLSHTLEQLRADYDVIIIDTPPVLAVSDALSLAPLADDVIMVVAWRVAPRSAVLAALEALRRAHVRVRGIVLSKVDLRHFARMRADNIYYAESYPAYHASSRQH